MVTLAPVDAPAPERPLINLLGAARTPGNTGRWQEGTEYEASCPHVWNTDVCDPDVTSLVLGGVEADDPEGRRVAGVAVYAVTDYDCIALPNLLDSYRDRVLAAADAELPRAVEHELWTGDIAVASALPQRFLASSDSVDLTPGAGAVSPNRAVGMLERAIGDLYSGVALIHATRDVVPFVSHTTRTGRVIETRSGNRLVPGVGYPGTGPTSLGRVTGVDAGGLVTGGTLADDPGYEYVVTATSATGETLPSTEVTTLVNGGGGTASVVVTWDPLDGATGYRVYGRQAGALVLLGEVAAGTETFTDTGAAALGPDTPPTVDTSNTAPDGEVWLYATPMVTVRVGDTAINDRVDIDPGVNRAHIIARTPFEVTWDGCTPAFAVRALLP